MRAALVGTIVATCAATVAATPAVADVKAGVDAWQQGDYAKAVAEWRPLAAAGDADAQFNLGQAYKLGRGVPADPALALDWFRKAGAQGHLRANDNYGLLLFQQGKREDAMPFIRKSAERGEPRAQYILGTAMFNGDLVPKDWVAAYALMTRAASAGLEQATTSLSVMDRYIGVEQRQKGLALATEMARAPKGADYAAGQSAPTTAAPPAGSPSSESTRPALAAPPRQVASASVPPSKVAPPSASRVEPPPRPVEAVPRSSIRKPLPPPNMPPPAPDPVQKEPPPTAQSAQSPPPPKREPPPPVARSVPAPAPVAERPSASGSWRVQMGAFREEPRARSLWQEATSRVSGLSGYKLFLEKGGGVTRMQAGPLRSEADAARLCGKLRAAGYACLIKAN
ncbi:hypothetical protein BH10PSE13_BH10PSE13_19320 [soil metagenome]